MIISFLGVVKQEGQAPSFLFLPKKYTPPPPCFFLSFLSRLLCFLTLSRFAQSVFNASQGGRDITFLSWTPLTIFPPQVSFMNRGWIAWRLSVVPPVALNPLVSQTSTYTCMVVWTLKLRHFSQIPFPPALFLFGDFYVIALRGLVAAWVSGTDIQAVAWDPVI